MLWYPIIYINIQFRQIDIAKQAGSFEHNI